MRASLKYSRSYAASRPNGLIWAGTTEEEAGFDEELTPAGRNKVLGDLLRMAPALSTPSMARGIHTSLAAAALAVIIPSPSVSTPVTYHGGIEPVFLQIAYFIGNCPTRVRYKATPTFIPRES